MIGIDVNSKWLRTRIRIARANLAKAKKSQNVIRIRAYEVRVKHLSAILETRTRGGVGVSA